MLYAIEILALRTKFSMLNNRSQHYTREKKAIKLESNCDSQRGIMLRLHALLDNTTIWLTDMLYNNFEKY